VNPKTGVFRLIIIINETGNEYKPDQVKKDRLLEEQ
jgi:hypothetical protein